MAKKGLRCWNKTNKITQDDFNISNKEIISITKSNSKVIVSVKYTIEQNKEEVPEITTNYFTAKL